MTLCFCTDSFGRASQSVLPLSCIFMTAYIAERRTDMNREPDSPPSGLQSCGADRGPAVLSLVSVPLQQASVVILSSCVQESREKDVFKSLFMFSSLYFYIFNLHVFKCSFSPFLLSGVCFITHSWCLSVCAHSRASLTVACAHEAHAAHLVGGAEDAENQT